MKDKILNFLEQNNIPYLTTGGHVAQGNVNICCPFCVNDQKYFMGIQLETGFYGCWWSPKEHGGRHFYKLVAKLKGCTYKQAKKLLGMSLLEDDDILKTVNVIFSQRKEEQGEKMGGVTKLELPDSFQDVRVGDRYWSYLKTRGFRKPQRLLSRFKILGCDEGRCKFRIIFPYYFEKKLVSWTARLTIRGVPSVDRHKDLSVDESVRHVKYCLYNYDELKRKGGKYLFVTEGIFDCLKLEYFLPENMSATCLSTKSFRDEQRRLLKRLMSNFEKIFIMLDNNAYGTALQIADEVGGIALPLPENVDDPGDFTKYQVQKVLRSI